ncbi:hypothetical protein FIBSPDRAFT_1050126 [Athelia psychrophila]|uniref:Uncharacterized protein n=1 Tax=Athelia psychrophila TaxID=1759441 RepID=A0A166B5M4_9AGAM|nr:hypothetical protein FIBSPDRAFT_1050126 [Fibularhizoctonia sp. CBS 109695]
MLRFLLFLCAIAAGIHALALPAVEATSDDSKCIDITHCRTIWNIIWSSLATIFACAWVSVHRNIPSPSSEWYTVLWERIKITLWALLVPEYIIAWAIRQWIVARQISEEFNELSKKSLLVPRVPIDSGVAVGSAMQAMVIVTSQADKDTAGSWRSKFRAFWDKHFPKKRWTVTHGFFVLMGGFYYFKGEHPEHPVAREDLEYMVTNGLLEELPNEAEINDKSKGDAFSKTVTVAQTLWFIAQCLARAIQGLTVTKLEIVTLAYTAISMAMYRFWWSKPLSVSRPIRLTRPKRGVPEPEEPEEPELGWSVDIKKFVHAVVGTQDDEVQLWKLDQAPTYYAGKPEEHQVLFADAIALAFAMIFGAVHCIAWSFIFPSHAEKLLWRISAIALVGVPAIYIVFVVLIAMEVNWLAKPTLILSTVGIPFYLLARVVLLVLAFTTLRGLPQDAYETIHWMTFIPHV